MALDFWEQEEWERVQSEKTWYERYLSQLERLPANRVNKNMLAATRIEYGAVLQRYEELKQKQEGPSHGD